MILLLYSTLIPIFIYLMGVLLVNPLQNFPLNDDWVYALNVLNTIKSGHLSFSGLETAWGIPQVLMASLFNYSPDSFHISLRFFGIISVCLSVFLLYFLLIRLKGINSKLIPVLLTSFVLFPPFFITSLSFMTDNFFITLLLATLLCFESAFVKQKKSLLFLGCFFALIGILQRQLLILLIFPLCIFAFVQLIMNKKLNTLSSKKISSNLFSYSCFLVSFVLLAFFIVINKWYLKNYNGPASYQQFSGASFKTRFKLVHTALFFFGLVALPYSLSFQLNYKKLFTRFSAVGIFLLFIISFVRMHFDMHTPFSGNVISIFGAFGENEILIGNRDIILYPWLKWLILCAGFYVFLFLITEGYDYVSQLNWKMKSQMQQLCSQLLVKMKDYEFGYLSILFGFFYVAAIVYRGVMFDRYILPAIPSVLIAIVLFFSRAIHNHKIHLHTNHTHANLLYINNLTAFKKSMIALMLFFLFSVSITKDYFAWNIARWDLLNTFTQETNASRHISLDKIDGGYEWNGFISQLKEKSQSYLLTWDDVKIRISFSPPIATQSDLQVLAKQSWYSIWPPHNRFMYLIEKTK